MEAPTPLSTSEMFLQLHPEGGPSVQIWALNRPERNDLGVVEADPEMIEMTEDLRTKLVKANLKPTVQLSDGGSVVGQGFELGCGQSLYITGHSQYQRHGSFLPISERRLGGFEVDQVVSELARAVFLHQTQSIELWCCETACTRGGDLQPNAPGKVHFRRFDTKRGEMIADCAQRGAWSEVSTLDYVCLGLAQKLVAWDYKGNLQVSAVNGVGLVEPDQPYIRTFDQTAMYTTAKELGVQEKLVANLRAKSKKSMGKLSVADEKALKTAQSEVEQLSASLEKHVRGRSCNMVSNFIHLDGIKWKNPVWLEEGKQPSQQWVYSSAK